MPPIPHPDPEADPALDGNLRLEVVAVDLDVTPAVARSLARSGALPAFKVGKQWRIGRREYAAWKADQARQAERRRRYTMGL